MHTNGTCNRVVDAIEWHMHSNGTCRGEEEAGGGGTGVTSKTRTHTEGGGKNSYRMMSYGDLALHTNSHRPQEGWAKPSAPPDLIQYEFLIKIWCDFPPPGG